MQFALEDQEFGYQHRTLQSNAVDPVSPGISRTCIQSTINKIFACRELKCCKSSRYPRYGKQRYYHFLSRKMMSFVVINSGRYQSFFTVLGINDVIAAQTQRNSSLAHSYYHCKCAVWVQTFRDKVTLVHLFPGNTNKKQISIHYLIEFIRERAHD